MYRPTGKPWTLPELQNLFADYFGNKLSSVEIERLAQDCASALQRKVSDPDLSPSGGDRQEFPRARV